MGGVLRPIVFSLANFGFNAEQRKLPGDDAFKIAGLCELTGVLAHFR
jgi:hypothetical protein